MDIHSPLVSLLRLVQVAVTSHSPLASLVRLVHVAVDSWQAFLLKNGAKTTKLLVGRDRILLLIGKFFASLFGTVHEESTSRE